MASRLLLRARPQFILNFYISLFDTRELLIEKRKRGVDTKSVASSGEKGHRLLLHDR